MSIEVSNIDHLGLVAGIIDEIGIEKKINRTFTSTKILSAFKSEILFAIADALSIIRV